MNWSSKILFLGQALFIWGENLLRWPQMEQRVLVGYKAAWAADRCARGSWGEGLNRVGAGGQPWKALKESLWCGITFYSLSGRTASCNTVMSAGPTQPSITAWHGRDQGDCCHGDRQPKPQQWHHTPVNEIKPYDGESCRFMYLYPNTNIWLSTFCGTSIEKLFIDKNKPHIHSMAK